MMIILKKIFLLAYKRTIAQLVFSDIDRAYFEVFIGQIVIAVRLVDACTV